MQKISYIFVIQSFWSDAKRKNWIFSFSVLCRWVRYGSVRCHHLIRFYSLSFNISIYRILFMHILHTSHCAGIFNFTIWWAQTWYGRVNWLGVEHYKKKYKTKIKFPEWIFTISYVFLSIRRSSIIFSFVKQNNQIIKWYNGWRGSVRDREWWGWGWLSGIQFICTLKLKPFHYFRCALCTAVQWDLHSTVVKIE